MEYLSLLFAVCVTAGIVGALAPEGSGKRYLEMLCSLCVICAVALPVLGGIEGMDGLGDMLEDAAEVTSADYEMIYKQYIAEGKLEAAEAELSEALAAHCEAEAGSVSVRLDCDMSGEPRVVGATVMIRPQGFTVSPEKIKQFMSERIDIPCQIVYVGEEK